MTHAPPPDSGWATRATISAPDLRGPDGGRSTARAGAYLGSLGEHVELRPPGEGGGRRNLTIAPLTLTRGRLVRVRCRITGTQRSPTPYRTSSSACLPLPDRGTSWSLTVGTLQELATSGPHYSVGPSLHTQRKPTFATLESALRPDR